MRVIIAGGRDVTGADLLVAAVQASGFVVESVISGGARGADRLGEWWANSKGLPLRVFHADWANNGKSAGPIRNEEMALHADALIALWDGQSRGTKDMIDRARRHGLRVYVHHVGAR